jgi:hypothetical protein
MKILRILLLLLLAYAVFAIATLPASFATKRIDAALADVEVNAVDGSIWSGSANAINYQGVALGALEWSARPASILRGEWRNHLLLDGIVSGEGELAVDLDGMVWLYDATLHTSLAELNRRLAERLPSQVQQLRGGVDAEITKLAMEPRGRELHWLEGDFAVSELRLGDDDYLGDFAARVTTVGERRFRSEVRSTGDRGLQLQGVVTTNLQGDVELDLEIANLELFGDRAAELLRRLMQKTEQGYYRLRWQGNIKYLIMLFG